MLRRSRQLVRRRGLTGHLKVTLYPQNKPNSLMMESVNGNIELMEAMLVLNNLQSVEENAMVRRSKCIQPIQRRRYLS